ncbi:MAG: FtsX-like permease family protein [Bacteroidaceae bacterium]
MNFPYYIARRYLISKKKYQAIHFISGLSVAGLSFATLAMVCTLSVFNGFQDMVATLFSSFDPALKITATTGKSFDEAQLSIQQLSTLEEVETVCRSIEGFAMVQYKDRQAIVTIKGVDTTFQKLVPIDSVLYGNGSFQLTDNENPYGVMGIGLMSLLGTGVEFGESLQVYVPKRKSSISISQPARSFNHLALFSPGVVFSINQQKYDDSYILTSLAFAKKLFQYTHEISSVELKLKDGVDIDRAKQKIQKLLGDTFLVKDRYQQQEDVFKVMQVEKLIAYLFLTFILLIASFNIVGVLSMLILDKREDVQVMQSLGATNKIIISIFLYEGRMIATFGAVIGILLGVLICFGQQYFGWLSLGNGSGQFIIDSYPVSVHWMDVVLIFLTVISVSFLAVWYPIHYLSKRILST